MKKLIMAAKMDGVESKRRVLSSIHNLSLDGVVSISVDMKNQTLTMIGNFDCTVAIDVLRTCCKATVESLHDQKKFPIFPRLLPLIFNFQDTKKLVMKVEMDTEESKKKVLEKICELPLEGVESITMDMKNQKLTMIGNFSIILSLSECGGTSAKPFQPLVMDTDFHVPISSQLGH